MTVPTTSPSTAPQASPTPPAPLADDINSHWPLDPSITFLNHGSFGSMPRPVRDAQAKWRDHIEARPIERLGRQYTELLAAPRQVVAELIGTAPENLGFVTNATGAFNAVIRSLKFEEGDEILTTNHVYYAVWQTMQYLAEQSGATARQVDIPVPLASPQQVVDAIAGALTDRTRLLVIDHITSPTAIVLPVEAVVKLCADRGIDVFIDGAHAPGMLDINVDQIGAAYYGGNLHKWVCAPKGSAFLCVRPDRQHNIHPTTISHFFGEGLVSEFNWQGTCDITGWLAVPDAIEFMASLGWDQIRRHNHELAVWAQAMLSARWGVAPITPADGSMLGSMVTLPLPFPGGGPEDDRYDSFEAFQAALYERYAIEIPIMPWCDRWWIRASCQVYNTPTQYEQLADAVLELVA